MAKMKRGRYSANPQVPLAVKSNVTAKAASFINDILKPRHVKTPSGDERFNYVVDIYSKWFGSYFYFCAKYACPGKNAISPYFESKFTRLEYVGSNKFNLSYFSSTTRVSKIAFLPSLPMISIRALNTEGIPVTFSLTLSRLLTKRFKNSASCQMLPEGNIVIKNWVLSLFVYRSRIV